MEFETGDLELKPFDAADYIESDDDIHHFLEASLEDSSAAEMARALETVMRAKVMMLLSQQTGLSRKQLADTLHPAGEIKSEELMKIYAALGVVPGRNSNAAE